MPKILIAKWTKAFGEGYVIDLVSEFIINNWKNRHLLIPVNSYQKVPCKIQLN